MIALLAGLVVLKADSISITMSGHGPENDLLVAKPTIVWQVWPTGDNLVSAATITIDGKKQKAAYDKLAKSVIFTPAEPFNAGEHQVQAQIVVNGWAKFDKKWSFKVLPEAYKELPEPTEASLAVLEAFNDVRKTCNIEPAVLDPRLCLSAAGHAAYLDKNPGGGHYQTEGKDGYIGKQPADRMAKMGFAGGSWEVLVPSVDDVDTAIKRLFDAPYHRCSMMNAGSIKAGGGYIGGILVIDGEVASEPRTLVSPADGQKDIQPFWKDSEVPDPFRLHSFDSRLVGYPIMFVRQGSKRLNVRRFILTDPSGVRVSAYENFPGYDDHLHAEAFIMPKKPLESNATYRVQVDATDENGKEVGKTWTFTTASSDQRLAKTGALRPDVLGIAPTRARSPLRPR